MTLPPDISTASSTAKREAIVACLGASITEAKASFDWIGELRQRPANRGFRFCRFGVGGDLAYNALARLGDVVGCQPDKVVVLIGHNDVLTLVSRRARRIYRVWKHLPCKPSPEWYRENVLAITRRLKVETSAEVALCSLFPIGEAPESANPFQRELNRRIEEYSAIVKAISREENVDYIPAYEVMREQIVASPGRAMTSFRILALYRDALRRLLLRRSLDDLARQNGWQFHTDGIHLNSRGGMMLADLVQQFIDRKIARD
jgi:lysophospholipase L1-like esterase